MYLLFLTKGQNKLEPFVFNVTHMNTSPLCYIYVAENDLWEKIFSYASELDTSHLHQVHRTHIQKSETTTEC